MKSLLLTFLLLVCFSGFAQEAKTIAGRIIDTQTKQPLAGATILIKESGISTISDNSGNYIISLPVSGKQTFIVSHVGYEIVEQTIYQSDRLSELIFSLNITERLGQQVVISASKHPEKITYAPAFIQMINNKQIAQFAGSNITELFTKVPGIEYTRAGIDDVTFNARGLNSAFNNKVFLLVDGRNTMAAASAGLALFNNGSTSKDDIERIEIVLGPQSALYGPNAHNALFNYVTKDPRRSEGLTVSMSAGNQAQYSARIRHALKINDRWAYKISGEYATGRDYTWYDSVYAGNQPPGTTPFFGTAVTIPERIDDFTFRRYRGEGHIYFAATHNSDIIMSAGGSKFTRLQVTTSGRNQLRDVTYGFLQARYVHPRFYVSLYNTWGSLGKSLLIGNYTRDFWNRTHSTLPPPGPNSYLTPDEAEVFASRLGNTIKEESQRTNAEVQYNNQFKQAGLTIITGLSWQQDRPNGYGISLIDSFDRIRVNQYGAVLQLDKTLPWQLRLVTTARIDHHSNLGDFIAPRFALLKTIGEGSLRVTWGRAYAMPSIQNQYAGIGRFLFGNGSGVTYIPNGTDIHNPSTFAKTDPLKPEQVNTLETGYKGNIIPKLYVDINYYNGISKNFISPARTVGGRVVSVNGIPVMHTPLFAGTGDTLKNASFLTFFNYGNVRTYGLDAGLTYTFSKHFRFTLNYSWFGSDITTDDLRNDANKDGYVSAEEKSLNAPSQRITGILNTQNLWHDRLFLNLTVRYVEQYDFYSGSQIGTELGMGKRGIVYVPGKPALLKNFDWGPLGGFTTFDLEAGYKISNKLAINGSITNLFNTRQVEFVGSPSIGRIVMIELKLQLPAKGNK